jgi:hypothetical protein
MMARLTAASWETIWRRSLMMAEGTCSLAEYQRMTAEKLAAVQMSMEALMTGRGHAAVCWRPLSIELAQTRGGSGESYNHSKPMWATC